MTAKMKGIFYFLPLLLMSGCRSSPASNEYIHVQLARPSKILHAKEGRDPYQLVSEGMDFVNPRESSLGVLPEGSSFYIHHFHQFTRGGYYFEDAVGYVICNGSRFEVEMPLRIPENPGRKDAITVEVQKSNNRFWKR